MEKNAMLDFTNPATGEVFGWLETTAVDGVQQAMRELRAASRVWGQKPIQERIAVLRAFQKVTIDALDEISDIITQDCGKSRQDALIEVFMTVDMLEQYCKQAPRWLKHQRVSSSLYLFKRCSVEHRPYGVVGVIAPWNYPFALSMPPVLAALLAGNAVILKPSEVTPAVGHLIGRLFRRVPELSSFVRVVHGDGAIGGAVVRSAPDYLFFTGSSQTARKIAQAAAENLTPIACELGGKDAMIVLEDADLPAAAHWGVWGANFNAGQTCMAVERVYVVDEVYAEFVRLAVEEAGRLKMGYTREIKSPFYLGPITDPRQLKVIRRHLEDAVDKGARILIGGEIEGMFVSPTVLVNVDHNMLVMQEETFGPLMPIMRVRDEQEAIHKANDNPYGLGASVWSANQERAQQAARQIDAGSVIINDTIAQFAVPMLPFGGVKGSGTARVHGKEGLMQFTRPFSYMAGAPPAAFDIATLMRKPGNYPLGAALIRVLFGVTLGQKVQPALDWLASPVKGIGRRKLATGIAGVGVLGAAAAGLAFSRGRRRR